MSRLVPGNLAKVRLGCLTAKQRRSSHITIAECVKRDDKWIYAGDLTKRAPRVRIDLNDVFLVLDVIEFEEAGLTSDAVVLLFGEKTVICDLRNIKRANKKDLLTHSSAGRITVSLDV